MLNLEGFHVLPLLWHAMFGRNRALYVTELLADLGLIGEEACETWPTPAGRQADFPRPGPCFHMEGLKEQWGERGH